MDAKATVARLLAATAICIIGSAPAYAADNGLESHDSTPVSNPEGATIEGDKTGVYSDGTELNLDNAGTIRGNGSAGGVNTPDGGVVVIGGPADITNSGDISGQQFGITTAYYFNSETGLFEGHAIGSTIDNSGSIIGDNDDGIRLIGGGTVTNSGYIAGRVGGGADGISIFAFDDQDTSGVASIGTVTNLAGGVIEGVRVGVILSNGGTVDNAGTISGSSGIIIQALTSETGKVGTVVNSGAITGAVRLNFLSSGTLDNSGSITTTISGSAVLSNSALAVTNSATGTITGAASGIFSSGPSFSLVNEGTIRGNGNSTQFTAPNGGVIVTGGPGDISNSGTISGQRFGITTFGFQLASGTNMFEARAIGTTVTNSGSIIGDNDDGIRLIGGGTVTNSGYIAGRLGAGADGVSMFSYDDQDLTSFVDIGTVTNLFGGTIEGNRFGVILSNGGNVDNAGTISGNAAGVLIQAQPTDPGRVAEVTNSGTINGGISFFGLASATVDNSGSIAGTTSGIFAPNALTLDNSGVIHGNGLAGGSVTPDAGVVVAHGPVAITNSGTISGQRYGITTALYQNPVTNQLEAQTTDTTIVNSGSIIGDADDGIRLGGGGATVTNSGYIAGRNNAGADGIAMFFYGGQDTTGLTGVGTVDNLAGGIIEGVRYGVILDGGGAINNAGTISNTLIQGRQVDEPVRTGTVTNSGTINGISVMAFLLSAELTNSGHIVGNAGFFEVGTASMTNSGSVDAQTYFVNVDTASLANTGALNNYAYFESVADAGLTNSGSIAASVGPAVNTGIGVGALSIANEDGGSITGASSGIQSYASSLSLDNAGTVRGNGNSTNFNAPDGGVLIIGGPGDVTNSGTISGQRFGLSTFDFIDPQTSEHSGRAIGTSVDNSGDIIGDNDDGIRLIGGGDVINSGHVAGRVGGGADGISMFAFGDQDLGSFTQIGTVTNLAGGVIEGNRFGIILSNGGNVDNAGTISGNAGGILIQAVAADPGRTGQVTNSGTINGTVGFIGLASASLTNSGSISATGVAVQSDSATTLLNSGAIGTAGSIAVQLSGSNDTVTLQTGSSITGSVDGGGGSDLLRLSGTSNSATSLQSVGTFLNVETLDVLGGYWTAPGATGNFASATVSGGTFAVNGSIAASTFVSAGGTLAGSGTVTGNVTIGSGGVLAPGNSIGTINVTGNVNIASGSTFRVETTPGGLADRLTATGSVSLGSGSTLQVLAGSGTYAPQTTYTIITADGGINGKFGTVTTDLAFLRPLVATKNNSLQLTLARNGKPINSAALASTFSTATAISGFDEGNPVYQAVLVQSVDGARQAFGALSGAIYNRLDALMSNDAGRVRLGIESARAEGAELEWTGLSSLGAQGLHSGLSTRRGRVSLMMLGGHYATRLASQDIAADVDTRFLVSAAGYRDGRFQALASVTSAWHDVAAFRTIGFPGFTEHASSRYSAQSQRVDLESSYGWSHGGIGIAPYAGYSRILIRSQGFQENGGFSALAFDDGSRSIDQARVGVRMASAIRLGSITLAPHADLSVNRSWGDLDAARQARFASGTENFDSIGAGFDRRSAEVDGGVDLVAGRITISGSYRGRFGSRWDDQSALLSAALRF